MDKTQAQAVETGQSKPRMTTRQWGLLAGGLVVGLLMGLFPPWRVEIPSVGSNAYREYDLGYSLVLKPPAVTVAPLALAGRTASVDWPALAFQWVVVAGVTLSVYLMLGNKPAGAHSA